MIAYLGASAAVASCAVILVAALDSVARRRSAAFRHGLWAAALGPLVAGPVLLGLRFFRANLDTAAGSATLAGPTWAAAPDTGASFPWMVLLWAVPAATLILRSAIGWALAARIAGRAAPLRDPLWRADAARAARLLDLQRPPAIAVSSGVAGPAVVGCLRPTLLLPPSAAEAPESYRKAILNHEFAHVARHDVLVTRSAALALALHWYNPLVWWAVRRLALAAECACDDAVLRDGMPRRKYARLLTEAALFPDSSTSLVGAGFGTAPVLARVAAIAAPTLSRRTLVAGERWLLAAATLFALLPLGVGWVVSERPAPDEHVMVLDPGMGYTFTQGAVPAEAKPGDPPVR